MKRGHDLSEIWVEKRVGPCLAWDYNKALCRAVEWSSCSRSVHTTRYNAGTHYTKLLSPTFLDGERYLNRGASESAFWSSKHHS